jgi:maleylpyruvate isomerase
MFVRLGCLRKPATPRRQSDPTCRERGTLGVLNGAMSSATSDLQQTADLLGDAAQRLTRSVDRLHDEEWAGASLLPGWRRAHVVSHLTLNAEGIARVLHAQVADDPDAPRTMYDSDERRDSDIDDLATAHPGEIRARLMAATTTCHEAMAALPAEAWEGRFDRTPGGRSLPVSALPGMRLREVEIHHVDLGAGYATRDWPTEFVELLLDSMPRRLHPDDAFELRPLDLDRTWVLGPDDSDDSDDSEYAVPVVTGPARDLAWWLTGRPAPDTVSCSRGELPQIEGW